MKSLLFMLLCAIVCSCNSDTESKGLQDVLRFYGGTVGYSKGYSSSSDAEDRFAGKFYEITVTDAGIDKEYKEDRMGIPASNMAYILYKAFSEQERQDYGFIRVNIKEGATKYTFNFTPDKLKIAVGAEDKLKEVIGCMRAKNYKKLTSLLVENGVPKENVAEVATQLVNIDGQYGKAKGFVLQGLGWPEFETPNGDIPLIKYAGVLTREKTPTDFSITVDPKRQANYLYAFKFQQ